MSERFYITTPIYYVNAVPHLGTFYSTVVADALCRYHRARGQKTFFLTGTDEHGLKIERMARDKGQEPKAYCDGVVAEFEKTWQRMGVSYDRFIRTTDADHEAAVVEMWQRMEKKGDIYAADYEGLYCVGCEDWKTDDEVVIEGDVKLCPTHRRPVEKVKEKNYFFRLSRYQQPLLDFYASHKDFVRPESRHNEVVSFVSGGLKDLSVSRMSVKWGIPVPGDEKHTIYVWIDALTNYLTAAGGPTKIAQDAEARALWTGCHHLIAKDILRFHAVYWPAMLMSAELPMPHGIFCHGYLTVKGQKISKSMPATRVDPNQIADVLGADPLRYFVLREYSLGADGDFTYESLFQRYESDLGNDLGNLANRTIAMSRQFLGDAELVARAPRAGVDPLEELEVDLRTDAIDAWMNAVRGWEDFAPGRALDATWAMIRAANAYIDRAAPWKLGKAGQLNEVKSVLANAAEVVRRAAMMLAPAMPSAARELLRQIGRENDFGHWPEQDWKGWPGGTFTLPKPVFPRFEAAVRDGFIAKWTAAMGEPVPAPAKPDASGAGATAAAATSEPAAKAEIGIDDFGRVELRAARVLAAERVPKTDKLLKLTLDLGTEQRTVVSGIAGAYQPEAIVGKTVIYLANLKPAKIRGVLSQGMILAAGDDQVLALSALDRDVPPGTKIR